MFRGSFGSGYLAKNSTNSGVVMPKSLATSVQAQTPASAVDKGMALPLATFSALNKSVQALRSQNKVPEALRQLTSFEGTASAAIFDYVEVAHTGYSLIAYNPMTHEIDPEATRMALVFINNLNTLNDYSAGYSDIQAIDQVVETSLLEVVTSGGVAAELVLDKARMPKAINIVSYDTLIPKSKGDGGRFFAQQSAKSGEISLDIPNFFVCEMHKFASYSTARSMMEPAINNSWYYGEFTEDMRKSVRNQHGRLTVCLDAARVMETASQEVRSDPEKLQTHMEQVRDAVKTNIAGANPEDALVFYDTAKMDMLRGAGEKSDYVPLLQNLSGNLATSLKVSPSIVGLRMEGSQSLSNTESLLFLKVARGVQKPVETILSRAMTLAVRLLGVDAYVEFRFDAIDLRPESELEAFRVMRQARILELLSLGFITDDQAAFDLGFWSRPAGAKDLSGTGFMGATKQIDVSKTSPNSDPQGTALQPKTPKKAGGKSQ